MPGVPKPKARQAFDDTIADARRLVSLAKALNNRRVYRMRKELREKVGAAMRLPQREWPDLDCVESHDLFVVIKPKATLGRDDLNEPSLRPLLRQALVAACAAVETFAADRVMERLGPILRADEKPPRLLDLPMTVGDWLEIEERYERRRWGLRQIIEVEVRRQASPAPPQIGLLFSWVGEKDLWKRVDARRKVKRGKSELELGEIYERRNKIAHTGDRVGRGRAPISVDEVEQAIATAEHIVSAIDGETAA